MGQRRLNQEYNPVAVIVAGFFSFIAMAFLGAVAINVMYISPLFYMPFIGFIFLLIGFLLVGTTARYIASKSFNPRDNNRSSRRRRKNL